MHKAITYNKDQKEKITGYLILAMAIIFWSSAFVGIRMGLDGYSPGVLAFFRFLVASVAMVPLYIKHRSATSLSWRDRAAIFFLGFFGIGIYHIALNYGELTVSSGMASFIIGLAPIFTVLLAIFFLKEKMRMAVWVGIAISFVGVIMIAVSYGGSISFDVGAFYILLSAFISGAYNVWQKLLLKKINAIEMSCLIIWSGTISLIMFLPELPHTLLHASVTSTLAVIYLGIFPGAISYTLWSIALKKLPIAKATGGLYTMPIISTFLGWLLLGEHMAILSFTGGCVALIGALIAQK
jgi:drug/metabolite transporter (DMT)-like permease